MGGGALFRYVVPNSGVKAYPALDLTPPIPSTKSVQVPYKIRTKTFTFGTSSGQKQALSVQVRDKKRTISIKKGAQSWSVLFGHL